MTEIKAEGLDAAREFVRRYFYSDVSEGLSCPVGAAPDHLRYALTVADALAVRLADVEGQLERARAVAAGRAS